jgi:hypothetical protein
MKTFTTLVGRQRKLLMSARQVRENRMCPTCGHATPLDGAAQWTWLALMGGVLPQEWECKESGAPESLCGCADPLHLRYE